MNNHNYRQVMAPSATKIAALIAALVVNISFATVILYGEQSGMYRITGTSAHTHSERSA